MDAAQAKDAVVMARIEESVRQRAANALTDLGLSIPDAIELFLVRVAEEKSLPFEINLPNLETRQAITELEEGKSEKFNSIEEMMASLNADD